MAYISEIKSRDTTPGDSADDFIEIVLAPGENPADFDLVFYQRDGDPSNVPGNGGSNVINLQDDAVVSGTLPDGSVIYSFAVSIAEGTNPDARSAVALDGPGGVSQFVAVGIGTSSPTTGPASGLNAVGVGNSIAGDSHFWAPDGSYVGEGPSTPGAVCFMGGSHIQTDKGYVPVEELEIGDKVQTRDNGLQEIRWIGHSHKTNWQLKCAPHLSPIKICKDSFGQNYPDRDLYLSPQHRVLMTGAWAELLFGESEVLCAAKHLITDRTISVAPQSALDYYHLMFDTHEVIKSNGLWSESFLPGPEALLSLHRAQMNEFTELFPEFNLNSNQCGLEPARAILRAYEAKILQKEKGA